MGRVIKHFNKLSREMINSVSFQNKNWKLLFSYIQVVGFSTDGCTSLSALPEEVMLYDLMVVSSFKINSTVV